MYNMEPYVEKKAFWNNIFKSLLSLVWLSVLALLFIIVVVTTKGVFLVLSAIGFAIFGFGALKSFIRRLWKAMFGIVKIGNCPYCRYGIKLFESDTGGFDCPTCKNRIVVQGNYFVAINK